MNKKQLEIGEISKPRFEFRTFGRNFTESSKLMAELSILVPENVQHRMSDEIYLVSRNNHINNIKIRDGKIDIKNYIKIVQGLEQWDSLMKEEFPISATMLKNDIFPAFQVEMSKLEKVEYSISEFLEMIEENPDVRAVRVHKERFGYMVNDTICEVANVLINDVKVVTINSESTEIKNVLKTLNDVKLNHFENINYLKGIKRVIGMTNKPLVN